jgi:hypothetical protein
VPFVKLDCGILDSTLWINRTQRDIFITALLMAEPMEIKDPTPQLEVCSMNETGFVVQPGWYGFVGAAGMGIIRRAMLSQQEGTEALVALGNVDQESRSRDFDGRRLVRVSGGYLVLNFIKYRDRDYTGAERAKRYRERLASRRDEGQSHRDITQAECRVQSAEGDQEKTPPAPSEIVEGLDQAVWDRWMAYRNSIKKPLKGDSIPAAQRKLAAYGTQQAAVVEQSIANGWRGMFALKDAPAKVDAATGKPEVVRMYQEDPGGNLEIVKVPVSTLKPWEVTALRQLQKMYKSKTIFYRSELNDKPA